MAELLLAFAQSIKVSTCRVRNTPRVIFLCGGTRQNPRAPRPYRSARDYFFRHVKTNKPVIAQRVRFAEDIGRWMDHGTFTDLLEVEEYIADLADLIVLFVESPGSIAELGAFSAQTTVQPKVLAVVNKKFKEPSFISDGPVRRLQLPGGSSVYKYLWDPTARHLNEQTNLDVFRDLSEEICDILQSKADSQQKEQSFNLKSHGHAMLMIADLIDIVFAATMTDIQDCLRVLGREVDRLTLEKYLFLLKELNIINEEYLNGSFYISRGAGPYIAYDFIGGARVKDRERAKFLIRSKLDGTRKRILARYLKLRPHSGANEDDHV